MTIREAQADDFDAIAAISNYYILNTPIHFGYDAATGQELRESWEQSREVYPFLVTADPTGNVVGFAKAYRWRERAAYARTAETGIYMKSELVGRGMGRALYSALIAACRNKGFHVLIGGIALPNPRSVALHESLGFTQAGTCHQVGWKFERWHDLGFWELVLNSGA